MKPSPLPPTVSSRPLIGCRSRLSSCSLAAIGPSVSSPSLAWLHSEVGEGLDAGILSNIWHVSTPPPPSSPPAPPRFPLLLLQTAACGGFNSWGLRQHAPLCAGASEDAEAGTGFYYLHLRDSQWTVTLVPLSYRCVCVSLFLGHSCTCHRRGM